MKKVLSILTLAAILFSLTACSSGDGDQSSGDNSGSASDQSSAASGVKEPTRLEKSFGELYGKDEYYISTEISVSSASSPDEVSKYELVLAADKKNNAAMMKMKPSQGERMYIIIRDGFSYNINEETGEYTEQLFTSDVEAFTAAYTTELYLGINENLDLLGTGTEEVAVDGSGKKQELYYEKYSMKSEDEEPSDDSVTVTYYFDGSTPKMEVMESKNGKTTFLFKEISDSIKDRSVFDVPNKTDESSGEEGSDDEASPDEETDAPV